MPSTVPTTSEFNDLVLQVNIIKDGIAKLDERLKKLEGSTTPTPEPTPIPTPEPPTPTPTPPPTGNGNDRFGIKKIYSDAPSPVEWAVNMDNPASTSNFKNLPTITKQSDGSFQTSATQVRMEAWSPINKKWLNVEITAYQKFITGTPAYGYIFQLYRGGGHHSENTITQQCWGAAYKTAMLNKDTCSTQCRKEVNHPAYCQDRAQTKTSTKPLQNRWIGMKQVTYNYLKDGKTYVRIEVWVDDDVTDAQGNLVIKNDWKLFSNTRDEGGWGVSATNTDFVANCPKMNKDSNQQYRQRDEILNMPGVGNDTNNLQNLCAWRSDNCTNNWKFLSVREITPPTT